MHVALCIEECHILTESDMHCLSVARIKIEAAVLSSFTYIHTYTHTTHTYPTHTDTHTYTEIRNGVAYKKRVATKVPEAEILGPLFG